MSKPKRDITLGEMQEYCLKAKVCEKCEVRMLCPQYTEKPYMEIDLTDPPRFSDEAMALLIGFRAIGAKTISAAHGFFSVIGENGNVIKFADALGISDEQIDLAELLGEDGK